MRQVRGGQGGLLRILIVAAAVAALPASTSLGEGGLLRARRWLRRPQPGVQLRGQLPPDVDPADLEPPEVTGVPPIADVMRELAAAQRNGAGARYESQDYGREGNAPRPRVIRPAEEAGWHNVSEPAAVSSAAYSDQLANDSGTGTTGAITARAEEPQVVTVELSPLGFHGVQPGKSRVEDVRKLWGEPTGTQFQETLRVDAYAQEPFREVRVASVQGVVRSIAIVLDGPLGRDRIVEHLGLDGVEAALLVDKQGNLRGYAYPECGIVLHVARPTSGSEAGGAAAEMVDGDGDESGPGHGREGHEPDAESVRLPGANAALAASGISVEGEGPQLGQARLPAPDDEGELIAVVVLEEIDPLAFVRRAEVRLPLRAEAALIDLQTALELDASCHAAHAVKSDLLTRLGRYAEALEAAEAALGADHTRYEYRLARVAALLGLGRHAEALAEAEDLLREDGQARRAPSLAARAALLAGHCYALAPRPDFGRAAQWHLRALKLAEEALGSNELRARKLAAVCLVEGHLAMAYDVAWGRWRDKPATVERWLERAAELSSECISGDLLDPTWELKLSQGALAALAGLQEQADPAKWIARAQSAAGHLLESTQDPAAREMLQWELGTALYDAVQIEQFRGELELALAHGRDAAAALAGGISGREPNAADDYLLGRLYYRLGAIHALAEENHIRATEWYDQARALLCRQPSQVPAHLLLPCGEMLVSMAVSYWEAGIRAQAIELTVQGTALMEQAVQQRQAPHDVLAVPYGNLASMFDHAGDTVQAARYRQLANKPGSVAAPR